MAAISAGVCVGRSRSTRSAAPPARAADSARPSACRSSRDCAACSSGSTWRASVGASGSAGRVQVPAAIGRRRRRPAAISVAKLAQLGVLGGLQAADLLLQRADAGDLADIGGDAQEQQVARDVEGARGDVALVGVGLHVVGAGQALGEAARRRLVDLARRRRAAPRRRRW